jgi:hypothetical protein
VLKIRLIKGVINVGGFFSMRCQLLVLCRSYRHCQYSSNIKLNIPDCLPCIYTQKNYGIGAALEETAAADDEVLAAEIDGRDGKTLLGIEGSSYASLGTAFPPVPTGG